MIDCFPVADPEAGWAAKKHELHLTPMAAISPRHNLQDPQLLDPPLFTKIDELKLKRFKNDFNYRE